jgi:ribose transport system permease protein
MMTTATTTSAPATSPSTSQVGRPKESRLVSFLRRWGTILVIIATGAGFSLASEWFLTFSNLNNVLFSMIVSCLVSMGLTYVVVVGSFDLSIGLIVTTTSIITALLIPVLGPWAAIVVALASACFIGMLNGLLVTYGRLSGIVVTLGMMFVLGGVNIVLTGGYQVAVDYAELGFLYIGQGKIGQVAFPVIVLLSVFVLAHLFATKTRMGHYITAVGDNPLAAYYSGISVYKWVIVSFMVAALLAGVGGVILTSISSSAQPVGGQGYLLEGFAAVYLGATVLGKGKPHILGTLLGVFFIYMVNSGMSMAGFPFAARQLFTGIILILAVGANALLNREELHMKFV